MIAMLDDGVGFNLILWRRVMEEQLGRLLRGMAVGANINYDAGFDRSTMRHSLYSL
jgi:hypothetical protein